MIFKTMLSHFSIIFQIIELNELSAKEFSGSNDFLSFEFPALDLFQQCNNDLYRFQQNELWNSFLHFCKANDACCGESFTLQKLTDEESKQLEKLNSVFVPEAASNVFEEKSQSQTLQAIKDRLMKVNILTNGV